jgi:hypothetical protein
VWCCLVRLKLLKFMQHFNNLDYFEFRTQWYTKRLLLWVHREACNSHATVRVSGRFKQICDIICFRSFLQTILLAFWPRMSQQQLPLPADLVTSLSRILCTQVGIYMELIMQQVAWDFWSCLCSPRYACTHLITVSVFMFIVILSFYPLCSYKVALLCVHLADFPCS